ncbi:MAG: type VII secretion protein EssC [Lachnospiraceae bacterium]|nr:type VII secretion protein EssC [Lachnospiraceae bacterium]
MGLVIAVYTKEAFKEYVMPATNNADYSVTLNRHDFRLHYDVCLEFEIINEVWKIKRGQNYRIILDKHEIRETNVLQDAQMYQIMTYDKNQIILLVRSCEEVFSAFAKYDIRRSGNISIGEGEKNLIHYDYQRLISREHAEIIRKGKTYYISCKGANGAYVNAKHITGTEPLHFGDFINIYSLHMVFLGDILAIDTANAAVRVNEKFLVPIAREQEEAEKKADLEKKAESGKQGSGQSDGSQAEDGPVKILFHRSPRIIEKIEEDTIEIEEPPKEMKSQKKPMLMTIGPSFTMAIPMLLGSLLMIASSRMSGSSTGLLMYSGMVMAFSSAIVGVIWGTVNMRYQRKTEAENETHRYEAYSEYLIRKTEEIKEKYTHNQTALGKMYPDANTCLSYDERSTMLWNRNDTHRDYLGCRLGLGDMDFQVDIQVPKEKFHLDRDELAEKPEFIEKNYRTLTDVPILLDLLEHRLVGIVGGKGKAGAVQAAKLLAIQLAACNCYTDVKLAFIYDETNSDDRGQWEFAKWLPHVWSEDKKIRYIASSKLEAGEVFYEIARVFRQRAEDAAASPREGTRPPKPYFILFLSDPALIEEELIAKYVFDTSSQIGLSTLMLVPSAERLPNACEYIVENDKFFQGIYNVSAQKEERIMVRFDSFDASRLDTFARRLSNLEVQEMENGGEIPSSITFFEMYGITRPDELKAEERWLKNRNYDNIKGLIGQKSGGAPCYMDVHEKYHGPHGLVAGTTGSGKSETLQTYMLSLAINYSPDDIGFFIIDYKGGGMAHLFDGLPHMIGQISNLSGNQVYRAMVSIKSENRRRQRIFTENGVNNINNYTKLYKNKEASVPVPHLFIIIDEFAELKREEPDFMKELISVAQVGRSLGVHLILATQKPSGTVDDNIWSNSKFRLCLRVQDRQDSNDMLHKPDAAYITQSGRCYLQVGNDEVYELFQSGWSGAPYDENIESGKAEIARLLTLNGKTELMGGHARALRKEQVLHAWISKLIKALEETGIQEGDSLQKLLSYRGSMSEAVEAFYERIAADALDYPRSEFNTKRLEDFIRLYGEARDQEDPAAAIVKLAAARGVKLPEAKERTQLDAVKDYLQKVAVVNGYQQTHQLWMPVLSDHIYLKEFEEYRSVAFSDGKWQTQEGEWALEVPVGMVDDPQNQAQLPLELSFSKGGHHAVIGSVVSGKSTMLQTIVYGLTTRYTPQYLNIYALDFSSKMMSAFEGLAHFGGIMYEGDQEKIAKFFNMIERILNERKKEFRGGNYSQYVQVHGVTYPAILIVIDNFSSFNEKTETAYEKLLIQLSKEGVGHGIFLLLSAGGFGMTEIPGRIGENIKTVFCLEMPDKFAYSDVLHMTQIQVLPEAGIKGRGLAIQGGRILEYQTALALEAEDDYNRMEKITEVCARMNEAWTGRRAQPIPEIPANPTWELFTDLEDVGRAAASDHLLPVGYNAENAEVYSVDLSSAYCYLITGAARTGKKNYMRVMIESALIKDCMLSVIDGTGLMPQYSNQERVSYVGDAEGLFTWLKSTLAPEFTRRNQIKKKLLAEGGEEEELYEITRKEKPVFVFITDMLWFVSTIYDAKYAMKGGKVFMESLTSKGRWHNIYFVGILNLEDKNAVRAYQTFVNFTSYKTGIHFGGNVSQNGFFNFDYLPFREQTRTEKAGVGQVPDMEAEVMARKVIVPLMGRKRKSS